MSENPRLFALLIDGDNVHDESLVPKILDKITEYGKPIIKKVYLNKVSLTSLTSSAQWDVIINEHSLKPEWIPNNTTRKNAADIALVIDAMDLLFNRSDITGFCIVSSDSDFTRLAAYIVEKNKFMLGIGEEQTPPSFRNACTKFIPTKDLQLPRLTIEQPKAASAPAKEIPSYTSQSFEALLIQAYENSPKNADEWVQLLELKEQLKTLDPGFQSSDYQNTRLFAEKIKTLAESYPNGVIEIDEKMDNKPVIHYVRIDCDAFRFIEAYHQAPTRERDGWVKLSIIGDKLTKHPAYENGFSYRGIRKNQLIKVVREMVKDYAIIEIKDVNDSKSVLYYIRIKSS